MPGLAYKQSTAKKTSDDILFNFFLLKLSVQYLSALFLLGIICGIYRKLKCFTGNNQFHEDTINILWNSQMCICSLMTCLLYFRVIFIFCQPF